MSIGLRTAVAAFTLTLVATPAAAAEWKHEFAPYLWGSAKEGTVGIGDVTAMEASIDGDVAIDAYRDDAASPTGGVGWEVETLDDATAPAYEGLLDLNWAEPIDG